MSREESEMSRGAGAPERWTLRPHEPGYPPGLCDLASPVRPAINGVGALAAHGPEGVGRAARPGGTAAGPWGELGRCPKEKGPRVAARAESTYGGGWRRQRSE